jgi:hypothetical protein
MDNPKSIILKILEIIGYKDDKEAFVNEFIKDIKLGALSGLIINLPEEKQKELKTKSEISQGNPQELERIINEYFTPEQIQEATKNSSQKMMSEYLQAINSTLSEEQKTNLVKLFEELKQTNTQTLTS